MKNKTVGFWENFRGVNNYLRNKSLILQLTKQNQRQELSFTSCFPVRGKSEITYISWHLHIYTISIPISGCYVTAKISRCFNEFVIDVASPTAWNTLPSHLRSIHSSTDFRANERITILKYLIRNNKHIASIVFILLITQSEGFT